MIKYNLTDFHQLIITMLIASTVTEFMIRFEYTLHKQIKSSIPLFRGSSCRNCVLILHLNSHSGLSSLITSMTSWICSAGMLPFDAYALTLSISFCELSQDSIDANRNSNMRLPPCYYLITSQWSSISSFIQKK